MRWSVERLRFALFRAWSRLARPMTLGVRVVARDAEGRVCLVRHAYDGGWHLPGGGVERGETCQEAAVREAREEAGLAIAPDALHLVSVHANVPNFPGDHVLVWLAGAWTPAPATARPLEIDGCGFFPLDALPEAATPGTRRRLAELAGAPAAPVW